MTSPASITILSETAIKVRIAEEPSLGSGVGATYTPQVSSERGGVLSAGGGVPSATTGAT
jgi:hypothetical protein